MTQREEYEMPLHTDVIQRKVRQLSQEAGEQLADELGYEVGERRQGFVECFVYFDAKKRYEACVRKLEDLRSKARYHVVEAFEQRAWDAYCNTGVIEAIRKDCEGEKNGVAIYKMVIKETGGRYLENYYNTADEERMELYFTLLKDENFQQSIKKDLAISPDVLRERLTKFYGLVFTEVTEPYVDLVIEWTKWNLE